MTTEGDATPGTLDQLSRQQLEIYAKELNEHFHKERRLRQQLEIYARELKEHFNEERCLRQELEGRNEQLEFRVREISALNRLFQEHLNQRFAVAQAYRELLKDLEGYPQDLERIIQRALSQPLPDLQDVPGLHLDDRVYSTAQPADQIDRE